MKSVKSIVLDGLKYFRQALLSDTPVENDTTHALSLAGAYSLQSQINSLNSKITNATTFQVQTQSVSHSGTVSEALDEVLVSSVSGYTPICICGWHENSYTNVAFFNMHLSNINDKKYINVGWATTNGANVTDHSVSVYILYKKNA